MIGLEVIGGLVLMVLAGATAWMAIVGLLGALGGVRMMRCRGCHHLVTTAARNAVVCPYCRHPWVAHHVLPVRLHHFLPAEMETAADPAGEDARLRPAAH